MQEADLERTRQQHLLYLYFLSREEYQNIRVLFSFSEEKRTKRGTFFDVQRVSLTAVSDLGRCPKTLQAFEKA